MSYLVTGASGFLGRHLCETLRAKNIAFKTVTRNESGDLTAFDDWKNLFRGINVVIHAAAKAHDMSGAAELKQQYMRVNFDLTRKMAAAAKQNDVRRFIFISTIKVNGEETFAKPFASSDQVAPLDDYGISKSLAEKALLELHEAGVFEVVIIRPCLVYGDGVKANFRSLMRLVKKGFPLPFGLIRNQRSLVSVDNLVDLILVCARHPRAGGQIFLVSDGLDLSLAELIRAIAKAQGHQLWLVPVPPLLLKLFLTLIGKKDLAQRLFSSLQVDMTHTRNVLNWTPPLTTEQSLQKMQRI